MLRQKMRLLPLDGKVLSILITIVQFFSTTLATCYNYNGSAVTIPTYKPCNGSAPVSMCCNLGQGGNGGDACGSGSTYGLCGVTGDTLWRESCSDPTWQSPVCLKLCVTGISTTQDSPITACDDGSYCCGKNNATCCDAGQGLFIYDKQVVASLPSSSSTIAITSLSTSLGGSGTLSSSLTMTTQQSSSTTSSTQSSSTSAAAVPGINTSVPSSTPEPAKTTSKSTKIIIGLCVVIGILAIAAISGFVLWKRTQWKHNDAVELDDHSGGDTKTNLGVQVQDIGTVGGEMDSSWRGHEIEDRRAPAKGLSYAEMPS